MQASFKNITIDSNAELFEPESFYEDSIQVITEHYKNNLFGALVVSSSFGKDSTLVVLLALEALRRLREMNEADKPLVIATSNTRIENPLVESMANGEMLKIQSYSNLHDLPVQILVAKPNVSSSWACKLIAGQGIAPIPGGASWCTVDFKIKPLERKLKAWSNDNNIQGELLTMTGTRFSESDLRGRKMAERGESSHKFMRNKDGRAMLSPIAELSGDDVWMMLGYFRSNMIRGAYSDFDQLFKVYAEAGGTSCAVVSDDVLGKKAGKRGECSARMGCFACTKVAKDLSLENMLVEHPELNNLYRIREYVAAITFDYTLRTWFGRTIKNGYITIGPDSYSSEVTHDLLRFCITSDIEERELANQESREPLFQIIDLETLIAIDFFWSVHSNAPAYEAWRIYHDIVNNGSRYHPPLIQAVPRAKPPAPRYLYVGEGWMDGSCGESNYWLSGLRDPLMEALEQDTGAEIPLRTLKDGREIIDYDFAPSITIDVNGMEATDFLQFILEYEIEKTSSGGFCSSVAARKYVQYGVVKYNNLGVLDAMLRRSAFRDANKLSRMDDHHSVMDRTISKQEFDALLSSKDAPSSSANLQLV